MTQTYHKQKLKGLIKIYVNQTQEASKVEKSWTPHDHQNVANFIIEFTFRFCWGANKIFKCKSCKEKQNQSLID